MDLASILKNAQHPDLNTRSQAEAYLNQAVEAQYGSFLLALCAELATEGKDASNRQLAGIYIKNLISAQDEVMRLAKVEKWLQCDNSIKEQIRTGFLAAIQSPVSVVSHTAAQVLAAYGAVDVPQSAWPSLLPSLFQNIAGTTIHDSCKVASLEALGYMCDSVKEDIDPATVNQILSSIVQGMRAELRDEIRLAAVVALNNSLGFASNNFENENERNVIMQAICEATQATNSKIRERAYECCATVAEFYYFKLQPYVQTLYQLTTAAIRTDEATVGMQAIEFWNTVSDVELKILEDIDDGIETEPSLAIISQAAASIVPLILECMTKQEEENDDDESWDISKAAATLLESMAKVINDAIVDMVLPFITSNINNTNWRMKEAAIMAFGMILDGPSEAKLSPLVVQALPLLVKFCMPDPMPIVRDTTAWTIGKICELHKRSISADILQPLIESLSVALGDSSPNVVAQVSYAIHSLAEACEEESDASTNLLSHIMPNLVPKLLAVATRPDLSDSDNVRSAAYEAINKMVENSAVDMHPFLIQLLNETLNRLQESLNPQAVFQGQQRMNLQSSLCSLISEIVAKLTNEEVGSYIDRIMESLLQVFNHKGAVAHEDAFLAIGRVADNCKGNFLKYLPYLQAPLIAGLKNFEEYQVCTVAVGIVGDLCRALGKAILHYCDDLMRCLLELLQSPVLNRSVKPHVFSLFADIAMAIEGDFERYCAIILGMLKQAGEVNIETDDEDLIEYINTLRASILEAYTGILQGLSSEKKQDLVLPAMEVVVDFLRRSSTDENRSMDVQKAAVGLIGDLAMTFGNKLLPVFTQTFVSDIISQSLASNDSQEVAQWAQERIKAIISGRA